MSVDRRLVNWGIFLILLGGIPLAVSQGWLAKSSVANAWQLWPLVLVGAGLGLILTRTRFSFVGSLVSVVTVGIVGGGLIAAPPSLESIGCGGGPATGSVATLDQGGTVVDGSVISLRASCATVAATTADGSAWHLRVDGPADAAPSVAQGNGNVTIESRDRSFGPFGAGRTAWTIAVPRAPRLSLAIAMNAGEGTFDLTGATLDRVTFDGNALGHTRLDFSTATVGQLSVTVNAADLAVVLPSGSDLTGAIEGNAASVRLCAPAGVGVRIRGDGAVTASLDGSAAGLVRSGNTWESPGFASAAHRVDLAAIGNAISYRVTTTEACQ